MSLRRLDLPFRFVLVSFFCLAGWIVPVTHGHGQSAAVAETPGQHALSGTGTSREAIRPDAAADRSIMDALDGTQKLAVGDSIIFRVLEDREDAKTLSVTDAGELDVPELGLVHAAGKTCRELAFEIKSRLEQTTYYQATVIVGLQSLNKTISGRRIYLAGQVRTPGPQEIPAGEAWTVSRAIMGAGGFTDYADKKQVRVVRAGANGSPSKTFVINIADILEKGRTQKDIAVEPEDLIYVPARAVNF